MHREFNAPRQHSWISEMIGDATTADIALASSLN